jgi:Zn-dependent protease with chaperone function
MRARYELLRPECQALVILVSSDVNAAVSPYRAVGRDEPAASCASSFNLYVTTAAAALPADELRAILAHELGHVRLHSLAAPARVAGVRTVLETVAGAVVPLGGLALRAVSEPFVAAYSRAQEAEADQYAVTLLKEAESDCMALVRVFERLEAAEGAKSRGLAFLRSHPSPERRIETVKRLCEAGP